MQIGRKPLWLLSAHGALPTFYRHFLYTFSEEEAAQKHAQEMKN
jgi:hypothetical protein